MPISEACPVGQPTNSYGRSKLIVEDMLRDLALSDPRWRIAILRYFNPCGRTRKRFDWRRPQRHPKQPVALHCPGSCGQVAGAGRVWRLITVITITVSVY
jgi:nucleoside-diphosphate-sugar epimerase